MFVHRVSFTWSGPLDGADAPSSKPADDVLSAWRMNGQVCSREWAIHREGNAYVTTVLTPEQTSLETRCNSPWVDDAVTRAARNGLLVASKEIGEAAESAPSCSCESPTGYTLFTTSLSQEPPLRCLDCFRPAPLYRLKPAHGGEFQDLVNWQADYQACDSLQMNAAVLERAATRELSHVDSALTRKGRAACETLAASAGVPFYYYLYRGHARSERAESTRRCPGCKGAWRLGEPLHGLFAFRCDGCRLLSNFAFDLGN